MRDLFLGVGLVAVSLALIAGAVFALGDETLLVSPPEIVAEQFVEAVALGRAKPARRLLAREAERATSVDELRRVSVFLKRRYGALKDLRATVEERSGDAIAVSVVVKGTHAAGVIRLPTLREQGQWRVARPNALLASAEERNPR